MRFCAILIAACLLASLGLAGSAAKARKPSAKPTSNRTAPKTAAVRKSTKATVPSLPAFQTAPGVSVQAIAAHSSLARKKIEEFDVSSMGTIIVRCEGALYDLTTGERLTTADSTIRSFAFLQGALAVVTEENRLGFWTEGQLRDIAEVPYGAGQLASGDNGGQLLLFGSSSDSGLFSFAPTEGFRPICAAAAPIQAAAGSNGAHLVAMEHQIFAVTEPGQLRLWLSLPDETTPVVGLAGTAAPEAAIFYSTPKAVSTISGGISLPLVVGIGGPLQLTNKGLLVLDRATGKLYRVAVSGLLQPPAPTKPPSGAAKAVARPAPGTLVIPLPPPSATDVANVFGIYVDRRLIYIRGDGESEAKERLELSLPPGPHVVEAAVQAPDTDSDINYPFVFRPQNAAVISGKTVEVRLNYARDYMFSAALSGYPEAGPTQSWIDGWIQLAQESRKRLRSDPVLTALMPALNALKSADRPRPVSLRMPEELGGTREYNATQMHMLVEWLKRVHWSWLFTPPDGFMNRMTPEMKSDFDNLREEVEQEKRWLDGLVKG